MKQGFFRRHELCPQAELFFEPNRGPRYNAPIARGEFYVRISIPRHVGCADIWQLKADPMGSLWA